MYETVLELTSDNRTISGKYRSILHISGQFNCCPDIHSVWITQNVNEQSYKDSGISLSNLLMACGRTQATGCIPQTSIEV